MISELPSKKYVKFLDLKILGTYSLGGETTWVKSVKNCMQMIFFVSSAEPGIEIPQ